MEHTRAVNTLLSVHAMHTSRRLLCLKQVNNCMIGGASTSTASSAWTRFHCLMSPNPSADACNCISETAFLRSSSMSSTQLSYAFASHANFNAIRFSASTWNDHNEYRISADCFVKSPKQHSVDQSTQPSSPKRFPCTHR